MGETRTARSYRAGEAWGDHGVTIHHPSDAKRPYFRITWRTETLARTREVSGGRTLDEARRRAHKLDRELATGQPVDTARRKVTAAQCAEEWLGADHPRWSRRNRAEHASRLYQWIIGPEDKPLLRHLRMGSLTTEDTKRVLAQARDARKLDADGKETAEYALAATTIRNIGGTLRQWSKWAKSRGYTRLDLMEGVSIADYAAPRSAGPATFERGAAHVTATMVPDQKAWLALADRLSQSKLPWMGLACELAATTGMRYGELAALRPQDVDLDRHVVTVSRALVCPADAPLYFDQPKSRARRQAGFPAYLADRLASRMDQVRDDDQNKDTLLFCSLTGKPLPVTRFHKMALQDALTSLKNTGQWDAEWTWRDLRHTAATWCLAAPPVGLGMSIEDVSRLLGHSTVSFTMNQYVGAFAGYETRTADFMGNFDPRKPSARPARRRAKK